MWNKILPRWRANALILSSIQLSVSQNDLTKARKHVWTRFFPAAGSCIDGSKTAVLRSPHKIQQAFFVCVNYIFAREASRAGMRRKCLRLATRKEMNIKVSKSILPPHHKVHFNFTALYPHKQTFVMFTFWYKAAATSWQRLARSLKKTTTKKTPGKVT